jgi:RNA polymerase sigma factor (sigma-70 family)
MDTDAQLLSRADRDPDAFAEFYARHERAVVTFVGGMVRDAEVVVDVVAETFARAYESRGTFSGEGARAWLLGIARHVVFAGWRREARERLGMRTLAVSDATLRAVEQAVLESEDAVVEAWLADLPLDQREAVRRRVLDEASYSEIAGELEISQAAARQRVSRGLAALRRGAT